MHTLLQFIVLMCVCLSVEGAYAGIVETNVTFSGTPLSCNQTCNATQQFDYLACSTDPTNWNSGARDFLDPIPSGYRAEGINITLHMNIGCTNYTANDGLVTVDSAIVSFLPMIQGSVDCDCSDCMQKIFLEGNTYPDGWPHYAYGKQNSFKLWFTPFVCLSSVTISIGYVTPSPSLLLYYPTSIPINANETLHVVGKDFLPSNFLFCSFGGNLTAATFIDSTRLTCNIPISTTANSTEFQLVDSAHNVLDGGEFSYYIEPTIDSINPASGPSNGGINVTLTGSNFFNSSSAACKFGSVPVFNVEYVDENNVICVNVADIMTVPRAVSVSFSENSNNYVNTSLMFQFTGIIGTSSPSVSAIPSGTVTTNSTASTANNDDDPVIPPFAWAAIAVAVLIGCILLLGLSCIFYQNRTKSNRQGLDYFGEESPLLISREASFIASTDPNTIPMAEIKNLKQIEKGSFGVIYEATWRGTKIAVKKLPTSMTDKQLTEFHQEAALMKSLRHPNILQYLGISQSGREVCICMEFMPLGSLYRILHLPNSSFTRQKIRSVCLDTVRGMNYLHQQHPPIVHRDLKSHNLLVDRHWQVKVCDFGLSRITEQNQTMTACGTPSWTAPEVLRNERYTTKADVYGFGIVIWEMFARADPFPGMPPFQIVFAVGTQKLRPRVDPGWPSEWVRLMETCWNEDPEARPTFEKLITILEGMSDAQ